MYPKIFWDSRFADAAPVASSTAAGFDAANVTDFRPFTEWQPGAMPATLRVDAGAPRAADYCLVWAHDLGGKAATLNVRRSPLGTWAGADDVLVAGLAPADDKPFVIEFPSVSSQHWGIELTGAAAPVLGIVALGAALEIPDALPQGFDPVGRAPKMRINRSVTGNPLGGTVEYEAWRQTLSFERLPWSWLRGTWLPAWQAHLRANPFGFAWDSATYPGELFLVNAEGGFETPHRSGSRADLEFTVEGLVA